MRQDHHFAAFHGTVTAFRRKVPASDDTAAICVDGRWLRVGLNDLSPPRAKASDGATDPAKKTAGPEDTARLLERRIGKPATVGMRRNKQGDWWLLWLVSSHVQLHPPTRAELSTLAGKKFARWLPWTAVSLAVALLSAYYMMASFAFVLLLVFALVALIVCGYSLYVGAFYLYEAWLDGTMKQAWRALDACLSGAPPVDYASPQQTVQAPGPHTPHPPGTASSDTGALPHLRRIEGPATHIEVHETEAGGSAYIPTSNGTMYVSDRIRYRLYQFSIGAERCVLFSSRNDGGGDVFLAEGDRVAAVLLDDDAGGGATPALVWAMRNMEDGLSYACHRIMAPQSKKLRQALIGSCCMTIVTPRYFKGKRKLLLGFWLLALSISLGVTVSLGSEDGSLTASLLAFMAAMPTLACGLIYAGFALVLYKWRAGYPTAGQRLAERVYALPGVPPVFAPRNDIREI